MEEKEKNLSRLIPLLSFFPPPPAPVGNGPDVIGAGRSSAAYQFVPRLVPAWFFNARDIAATKPTDRPTNRPAPEPCYQILQILSDVPFLKPCRARIQGTGELVRRYLQGPRRDTTRYDTRPAVSRAVRQWSASPRLGGDVRESKAET
jgi:hypothetical protein